MKSSNKVILITGGNSGIGYETAKLFSTKNNTIIICGKDRQVVQTAAASLPNTHGITCDITDLEQMNSMVKELKEDFGGLNLLINNAAVAFKYNLLDDPNSSVYARKEMDVNYFAPIRLTEKLLPILKKNAEAAIINITAIFAPTPSGIWVTYNASKAAFQAHTNNLRNDLKADNIKVFEAAPALTDTKFSHNIPGRKLDPSQVAAAIINGFENNVLQNRIGFDEKFYDKYLTSLENTFGAMNNLKNN